MLTIAYLTSRVDNRVEWFLDSLHREHGGNVDNLRVVIVDFHEQSSLRRGGEWLGSQYFQQFVAGNALVRHVSPKPNVWQGPHRLTKEDWFAASNARNTAICLAEDGWLACVDDLSVLLPGWLNAVREAMAGNYIVCGAYKKVKNLVVEKGEVKSFEPFPAGVDNRLSHVTGPTPCGGQWLFGCSFAAPVEALLSVNGFPEHLGDGHGFEDCLMGLALQNAGHKFVYDPRMMTYESEELHHVGTRMRKEDWHFENDKPVLGGNGGTDKSHAALAIAQQAKWFEYDVGGGFKDLRELRAHVLKGGEFPVRTTPDREWFTGMLLSEL